MKQWSSSMWEEHHRPAETRGRPSRTRAVSTGRLLVQKRRWSEAGAKRPSPDQPGSGASARGAGTGTVRKMRAVGTCACIPHPEERVKGVPEEPAEGVEAHTPISETLSPACPPGPHSPTGRGGGPGTDAVLPDARTTTPPSTGRGPGLAGASTEPGTVRVSLTRSSSLAWSRQAMSFEGWVGRSARGRPNLRLHSHSSAPSPEEGLPGVRTELPRRIGCGGQGPQGGTEWQAGRAEAWPARASAAPTAAPRAGSALRIPSWKTSSIQINAFTCTGLRGF